MGDNRLPAAMRAGQLISHAPPAVVAPFAENPKLLVAGPPTARSTDGPMRCCRRFEQSLPPDTSIRRVEVGSADGVTGANQFEVRGAPDGQTVLLAPGQAALAWMVGDPRAKFDVAHWVPVVAGTGVGLVVGRASVFAGDARARVVATNPAGSDLAALLGLYLLGVRMEAGVRSRPNPARRRRPSCKGSADVVMLHGATACPSGSPPCRLQVLSRCSLSARWTIPGDSVRDATYPQTCRIFPNSMLCAPAASRMGRCTTPGARLRQRATGVRHGAAATDSCRDGVAVAAGGQRRRRFTRRADGRGVGQCPACWQVRSPRTNTAAIATNAAAMQELRRWLAGRFNWRPA